MNRSVASKTGVQKGEGRCGKREGGKREEKGREEKEGKTKIHLSSPKAKWRGITSA